MNKKILIVSFTIILVLALIITILNFNRIKSEEIMNESNDTNVENPTVNRAKIEESIETIADLQIKLQNDTKLEDIYGLLGKHINSIDVKKYNFVKVNNPQLYGNFNASYKAREIYINIYLSGEDILAIEDTKNGEIIQIILGNGVSKEVFYSLETIEVLGDPEFETIIYERLYKEYAYPSYGLLFKTVSPDSPIERGTAINIIPPMSPEEFKQEYKLGGDELFHKVVYGI